MAATGNNRYALFVDQDENDPPVKSPWQEVRKRGAPAVQPVYAPKANKRMAPAPTAAVSRARAASASTTEDVEKAQAPYENWCGVCSIKFPSKAALLSHVKQTPLNHKHYCNLCKRVFKDRNGLKNHVENSSGHGVCCNLCLSAFNNTWGLRNHFENNHSVGHEFVCLTCLLGFRTQVELERHLQFSAKHTWCEFCHRQFRSQDERDEHWQKTTKHKHCLQPGCDFDGPDQTVLNNHLEHDHFQCSGCKSIFPSQTKLNHHAESCTFAVVCQKCLKPFVEQAELAIHMEHCSVHYFFCKDCSFSTNHEGNYQIHMTKHASAQIPCWGCNAQMRTYSSLLNHLESGKCPKFHIPWLLVHCLGQWWYSPLYMDLDLHAQLRTSRIDPEMMRQWMDSGVIMPFICRDQKCNKEFGHLSSLILHCESHACGWDVARLNMPGLEKEFKHMCIRRDSATA